MPKKVIPEDEPKSLFPRFVYTICEGLTEKQYLNYFFKYHDSAGFYEHVPYEKKAFDFDQTDRSKLIDLIEGYAVYMREGRFTPYFLSTKVLYDLCNYYCGDWENIVKPK